MYGTERISTGEKRILKRKYGLYDLHGRNSEEMIKSIYTDVTLFFFMMNFETSITLKSERAISRAISLLLQDCG